MQGCCDERLSPRLQIEESFRDDQRAGSYEPLKTISFEGKRDYSSQSIKDEVKKLLRDVELDGLGGSVPF